MRKHVTPDPIQQKLMCSQDMGYRDFTAKLIPTLDRNRIIGVRIPALRALAREVAGTPQAQRLLNALPHCYHEENLLHAFLIGLETDADTAFRLTEAFLPHIDNWATCDSFSPRVFKKHPHRLYRRVLVWLKEEHPYTQRFAIGMLMQHFLGERFDPHHLQLVAGHESSQYYVNMMRAWYFATALTKQYAAALPILESRQLDRWTHLKSIQKAVESRLVIPERKAHLKSLRYRKPRGFSGCPLQFKAPGPSSR